ncbi:MAG TPA: hypothetical protein VM165_16660, partial [Planctomycetaceae bacterium]|nr:hypothetical protein [Planctomycetaceae bacterium]
LDRTGFHPSVQVEVVQPPNPYAGASEDEMIDKLETLLAQLKATRDFHRQHALPADVEDGFVVPEDDDPVWAIPLVDITITTEPSENTKENAETDRRLQENDVEIAAIRKQGND